MVRDNGVGDPATSLGYRLVRSLSADYALTIEPSQWIEPGATPVDGWTADLVLASRTEEWSVSYFFGDYSHYRVWYHARVELYDRRAGRWLAIGNCKPDPRPQQGAPDHDQLLANRAAALKAELARLSNYCARKYAAELLKTTLPDPQDLALARAAAAFGRAAAKASAAASAQAAPDTAAK